MQSFNYTAINPDDYQRGLSAGYTAALCAAMPLPSSLSHAAKVWSAESVAARGADFAKGFEAGQLEYRQNNEVMS